MLAALAGTGQTAQAVETPSVPAATPVGGGPADAGDACCWSPACGRGGAYAVAVAMDVGRGP